ncbi:hypothetical protein [Arthrobacter sp. A2-55]|nr:hypothetical protein [Arthrobacter sp. A2-55]
MADRISSCAFFAVKKKKASSSTHASQQERSSDPFRISGHIRKRVDCAGK